MNASKGIKNVVWGLVAQIFTIGFGIVIPRLVLLHLGSEANGLLGSLNSVMTYMSLLEAGVGTAALQALYRPFSEDDRDGINGIMSATWYYYRRTGVIYLAAVIVIAFIYTFGLDTTIPKSVIFTAVILSGLSGVISYFFQGMFRIFLAAEGKRYVFTNISTVSFVMISVCKIAALLLGGNVIVIQLIYFIFNLLQVTALAVYMKRHYRWLDLSAAPDLGAVSQKNSVLVHKVTELIFNNTDVLILTMFTNLMTVSVYNMYGMIYGMVRAIAVTCFDSFQHALGQSFSDRKKFLKLYDAYETYGLAFTFGLFCIAYILMLPFIKLYTAGVTDINYIDPYVSLLFVIFYLMQYGRFPSNAVIEIAQHFEQTKWRAVAEAAINLTVSVICTIRYGIYGVLFGTVAALLYRTNDVIIYASRLLERSPLITYRRWITDAAVFAAAVWMTSRFGMSPAGYGSMVVYGIVLVFTVMPAFLLVSSLAEPSSAAFVWGLIKKKLRGHE